MVLSQVLAVGRRLERLELTRSAQPELITSLRADVGTAKGQQDILAGVPSTESIKYLVHNAAVGEPGRLGEIDGEEMGVSCGELTLCIE